MGLDLTVAYNTLGAMTVNHIVMLCMNVMCIAIGYQLQ